MSFFEIRHQNLQMPYLCVVQKRNILRRNIRPFFSVNLESVTAQMPRDCLGLLPLDESAILEPRAVVSPRI
jgi:hypothetical protein